MLEDLAETKRSPILDPPIEVGKEKKEKKIKSGKFDESKPSKSHKKRTNA